MILIDFKFPVFRYKVDVLITAYTHSLFIQTRFDHPNAFRSFKRVLIIQTRFAGPIRARTSALWPN